jgi:hypothetical protein
MKSEFGHFEHIARKRDATRATPHKIAMPDLPAISIKKAMGSGSYRY